MSFRIHQNPEISLQAPASTQFSSPSVSSQPPPAPQIDVAALQSQLMALQNQVNVLQATQKVEKDNKMPLRINLPVLQPTPAPLGNNKLQLPQNEVVLLSVNRSPCASPRISPR
jgi:hypothetical protein